MKKKRTAAKDTHRIVPKDLASELERKRRQRMRESLKESEAREALEKSGQRNLFAPKQGD